MSLEKHWYLLCVYFVIALMTALLFGKGISCTKTYKWPTQRAVAILRNGEKIPLCNGYDLEVRKGFDYFAVWDYDSMLATIERSRADSVYIEYIEPEKVDAK